MIDKLQRIAATIQPLRLPAMAVALAGLGALIVIVLTPELKAGRWLTIPSTVSLIWGMSTYAFIVTFLGVPKKPDIDLGLFVKLKYTMIRCWYGIVGVIFLGATIAIVAMTIRMTLIWLKNDGG